MKRYSNILFVIALTFGLGLTCLNASAATSNQDSSPVFDTKSYSSFDNNIDISSNYFVTPFNSTNGSHSSFGIGLKDRNQFDMAKPHSDKTEGYSNQWNSVIREIGSGDEKHFHHDDFCFTASPVPEPSDYLLIAFGLAIIYLATKRRREYFHFLDNKIKA